MDALTYWLIVASVSLVVIYRRIARRSIKRIQGPTSSFLRGNIRDFSYQNNVGDMDFQYAKQYGLVWRMAAPLGQDVLMIADPKALQHILHKSGYAYSKSTESIIGTYMIAGHSILNAPTGDVHSRHRKVMNPAFSAPQLRSFLPLFQQGADKLCRLLKAQVLPEVHTNRNVVAINQWLSRATLDIIGETAFHFEFEALDHSNNEVTQAYDNLIAKVRMYPTVRDAVFRATWKYIPYRLLEYVKYLPTQKFTRLRNTKNVIDKVASALVEQAIDEARRVGIEKGKKDVMSVLVRANLSENPSMQLSKDEMMSQMAALTFAGHETTANTLSWLLWELSKHPEFQDMLREEIRDKREEISSRDVGDEKVKRDFSIEDLESMPFLQALLKEILRYHPIVYHLMRVVGKDDVIPLSEPVTTTDGELIDEIPIGKGQTIMFSICTYNRIKRIWGEDADIFNPMRFVEGRVNNEYKVGMYGGLMSFSAGLRGCIGWRFSLIEMQAILVALIENFEFSLPSKEMNAEIVRMPIGLMSPMVKGKLEEGVRMPLTVKVLKA